MLYVAHYVLFSQVSYLGVVGGKSEEDTVERVLNASISNGLARMFNWNGVKGKKAFKSLELCKVLFGTVTLHYTCWCKIR